MWGSTQRWKEEGIRPGVGRRRGFDPELEARKHGYLDTYPIHDMGIL
jgi:hypothetical protein